MKGDTRSLEYNSITPMIPYIIPASISFSIFFSIWFSITKGDTRGLDYSSYTLNLGKTPYICLNLLRR